MAILGQVNEEERVGEGGGLMRRGQLRPLSQGGAKRKEENCSFTKKTGNFSIVSAFLNDAPLPLFRKVEGTSRVDKQTQRNTSDRMFFYISRGRGPM